MRSARAWTLVEVGVGKDLAFQSINLGILLRQLGILGGQSRLMCLLVVGELCSGRFKVLLQLGNGLCALIGRLDREPIDQNFSQIHLRYPFICYLGVDGAHAPLPRTVTDASF